MSTHILYANTVDEVRPLVAAYYRRSRALQAVRDELDRHGLEGWLFGGAIRTLVTDGATRGQPRDLDIVVCGSKIRWETLRQMPPITWAQKPADPGRDFKRIARAARYGRDESTGEDTTLRAEVEGMDVDLWHIDDQWSLGQTLPRVPQSIPLSGFLTTEAIVATFSAGADEVVVHDGGFMAAATGRYIDQMDNYRIDDYENSLKYAVKAAIQAHRLGWKLTPRLHAFCVDKLSDTTVAELKEKLTARYGDASELAVLTKLAGESPATASAVVPPAVPTLSGHGFMKNTKP